MKKILLTILAVAAVLTSCKKEVFPERPSGKGILTFSLGCDESGYVEVKSSDTQVDMSNFNITVYKLEDEYGEASDWTKSWLYSEFPESVELALTSTGKHAFEMTMMRDYCSEDGEDELFSIIVAQ